MPLHQHKTLQKESRSAANVRSLSSVFPNNFVDNRAEFAMQESIQQMANRSINHPVIQRTTPVIQREGGEEQHQPFVARQKQKAEDSSVLLGSPEYRNRATAFEANLTRTAYTDPNATQAAKIVLNKLVGFVRPGPSKLNPNDKIKQKFFAKHQPEEAGSVSTDVAFDKVITQGTGNLREDMKAIYNVLRGGFLNKIQKVIAGGYWLQQGADDYDRRQSKEFGTGQSKAYNLFHKIGLGTQAGSERRQTEIHRYEKFKAHQENQLDTAFLTEFRQALIEQTGLSRTAGKEVGEKLSEKLDKDKSDGANIWTRLYPTLKALPAAPEKQIEFVKEMEAASAGTREKAPQGHRTSTRTPADLQQLGAGLSPEEAQYLGTQQDEAAQALPWMEGQSYWRVRQANHWVDYVTNTLGMKATAGGSGSMARMLTIYKMLNMNGAGTTIQNFRLAVMGWMLAGGDHSFHEMMIASASVDPVFANEYQPGPLAYTKISPLTENQLRQNVCEKRAGATVGQHAGLFPHEHAYWDLMSQDQLLETPSALTKSKWKALKQSPRLPQLQSGAITRSDVQAILFYTGPGYQHLNKNRARLKTLMTNQVDVRRRISELKLKRIMGTTQGTEQQELTHLTGSKPEYSDALNTGTIGELLAYKDFLSIPTTGQMTGKIWRGIFSDPANAQPDEFNIEGFEQINQHRGRIITLWGGHNGANNEDVGVLATANQWVDQQIDQQLDTISERVEAEAPLHKIMLHQALEKLPKFAGGAQHVWRGGRRTSYNRGDTISFAAGSLISTSVQSGIAGKFAEKNRAGEVWEITLHNTGADIRDFSRYNEGEILIYEGVRLRVDDRLVDDFQYGGRRFDKVLLSQV